MSVPLSFQFSLFLLPLYLFVVCDHLDSGAPLHSCPRVPVHVRLSRSKPTERERALLGFCSSLILYSAIRPWSIYGRIKIHSFILCPVLLSWHSQSLTPLLTRVLPPPLPVPTLLRGGIASRDLIPMLSPFSGFQLSSPLRETRVRFSHLRFYSSIYRYTVLRYTSPSRWRPIRHSISIRNHLCFFWDPGFVIPLC